MFLAKADEMFSLRHAQLFQCRLFCVVHGFGSFGCQFPPGWRQVQQFAAVTARRGFQFQQSLPDHRSHG